MIVALRISLDASYGICKFRTWTAARSYLDGGHMQIYTIPGGGNYDLFSKKMVKMHEGIYASDVCRRLLLSR